MKNVAVSSDDARRTVLQLKILPPDCVLSLNITTVRKMDWTFSNLGRPSTVPEFHAAEGFLLMLKQIRFGGNILKYVNSANRWIGKQDRGWN